MFEGCLDWRSIRPLGSCFKAACTAKTQGPNGETAIFYVLHWAWSPDPVRSSAPSLCCWSSITLAGALVINCPAGVTLSSHLLLAESLFFRWRNAMRQRQWFFWRQLAHLEWQCKVCGALPRKVSNCVTGQQEFVSVWRLAVLPSVTSTMATWSPMKTIWRPAAQRTFAAVLSSKLKGCYWSRGSASCGSRKALRIQLASRRSLERDARKELPREYRWDPICSYCANVPCELFHVRCGCATWYYANARRQRLL